MPNKIYIVAGERNMKLAQIEGGLWANVGQTTRDVSDRLRDDDYKRKAAGGRWQTLLVQDVGENLTDHQVHPLLKQHPEVSWDRESDNTEEFFFKGDPGDGSVARRIVSEILRRICVPLLQQENSKLHEETDRLRAELEQANNVIRDLSSDELISVTLARIREVEGHNDLLMGEKGALQSEVERTRESELMMRKRLENEQTLCRKLEGDLKRRQAEKEIPWDSAKIWGSMLLILLIGVLVGRNHDSEWDETFKDHTPKSLLEEISAKDKTLRDLDLQRAALDYQLKKIRAESDLGDAIRRGLPQSKHQTYRDLHEALGKEEADRYARENVPVPAISVNSPKVRDPVKSSRSRVPSKEREATPVASPPTAVHELETCTAMSSGYYNKIKCETSDSIIEVQGPHIELCVGAKVSFRAVGKSIIASCSEIGSIVVTITH